MAPAVDRLAAARAHRSQATARPQIPPADSDFPSDSTSSNYDEPFPSALGAPSVTLSRSAFLSEVSSVQVDVQSLNGVVAQIAAAHSLHLSSVDTNPQIERDKLDRLTADAHLLMRRIKERIQRLEGLPVHEDAQIRINQISVLRRNFLESLQNYQKVEFDADLRFKRTIGNRLKLVKPDVTSEEVDSFVEGGNQQVFAQALINSTRYGESRRAFREVEERHNELQRMERTLLDLTRLFNDMGFIVEQQEPMITQVENTAQDVSVNTAKAYEHTEKAVTHARHYRKGRIICFGVFLIICAVLALILGLVFGLRNRKKQ